MIRLLIVLLLISQTCHAGPWPRGAGKSFVALSYEAPYLTGETRPYSSLYFEYGLSDLWTVGLDAGADLHGSGSALAFLHRPIFSGDSPWKVSAEMAIGTAQIPMGRAFVVRPGLSVGRGYSVFNQTGWATLDLFLTYAPDNAFWLGKAEGTVGLNLTRDSKLLLQVTSEQTSLGERYHSVGFGGAYQIKPGLHVISGLVQKSQSPVPNVKIGLWYSF